MTKFVYNVEDIFENIPDDVENVLLKVPPEIIEITGWKPGDLLNITLKDGELIINKNG
jgi:frataxin-like iron-binding protein CyaY